MTARPATVTVAMLEALARMPLPGIAPAPRPLRVHTTTIARLLAAALIEEPVPRMYRRTASGHALLQRARGVAPQEARS